MFSNNSQEHTHNSSNPVSSVSSSVCVDNIQKVKELLCIFVNTNLKKKHGSLHGNEATSTGMHAVYAHIVYTYLLHKSGKFGS